MNKERQQNPDEILNSLDGLQKATAPEFFYTRLKARMERELLPGQKRPAVLRPLWAIAGLILIVLLNLAVILRNDNKTENAKETETYLSVSGDYNLNDIITEEVYR